MRGIDGIGNLVLVVMAACSLISMIAAFGADMLVNRELYSYGLQFSSRWAIPYWNAIGTIFVMGWLNIIVAVTFQIYMIRTIRKEKKQNSTQRFENKLRSEYEQKNTAPDDWNQKKDEAEVAKDQAAIQEPEEQVQKIPYETVTCEQIAVADSEQTED